MCLRRMMAWMFVFAVGAASCQSVWSSDRETAGSIATRWATYESESGDTFYALSVHPRFESARESMRIVVMMDTSASQTGQYRVDSLSVLEELLGALPTDSQVALVACDLKAVPMTGGFVGAGSTELQEGLEKLKNRLPLGTTNMARAIEAAISAFGDTKDGVFVYIGDGVTGTGMMTPEVFQSLVGRLVASRTTMISLAIGPFFDTPMLATLAMHTGGQVYIHNNLKISNEEIGSGLAAACGQLVFWPTGVNAPASIESRYPEQFPPLRSDRDSIVVGKLKGANGSSELRLSGVLAGKESSLSMTVRAEPSHPDFAFVGKVVAAAEKDRGLMLPLAGSDALRELGLVLADSSRDLIKAARFALQSGKHQEALNIANEALKLDPNNEDAIQIRDAASMSLNQAQSSLSRKVFYVSTRVQPPDDPFGSEPDSDSDDVFADDEESMESLVPSTLDVPQAADSPLRSSPPSSDFSGLVQELTTRGDLLSDEMARRKAAQGALETRVSVEIRNAQSDPNSAIATLKILEQEVSRTPDLDPAVRLKLQNRIATALQSAAKNKFEAERRVAQYQAVQAAASAGMRLVEEKNRNEAAIQQLVERFNALMAQQLYFAANNEISPIVNQMARESVIGKVVENESNIAANFFMVDDVLYRRRRAFVDLLNLAEVAAIPFADDPPVVFPPPEKWREIVARRERYASIDLAGSNPTERNIFSKLNERVELELNNQTLKSVVEDWRDRLKIPILIDETALQEESLSADDPVPNMSLPQVSFRSALRLVLLPMGLTYVIDDEVLKITTKTAASSNIIKVYPVGDLVVPISSGGMMGGMGGMGGGMFTTFDDAAKPTRAPMASQEMQTQSLRILEELRSIRNEEQRVVLGDAKSTSQSASVSSLEARRREAERQFAELISGQVKAAQLSLAKADKDAARLNFQTIIDAVSAALCEGFPQPWMYEALSISMQACDYPDEEIVRVLMSAVDFGGEIDDFMKIAKHLLQRGKKQEGLMVLRDIHQSAPLLAEPLELALPVALELRDIEALTWTCRGVLSQAWPDAKASLIEQAMIASKATYARLIRDGRIVEAKAFERDMQLSLSRDIVVRITWTGDADLDLSIEEPAGTICSFSNPRTPSGGMLLGDSSSIGKATANGVSETYVCPQGYAGKYRVLIHKVWGEIAAGKVTVEVLTDYGTPDESFTKTQIELADKDVVFDIEVKNGHRQQPIVEAQLAEMDTRRLASGRAILAQQFQQSNGSSIEEYYRRQQILNGSNNGQILPPFRRGAVGYMPIITVLPIGTMMFSQAVISGDRKWVRFSNPPFFFDILQVDTFNFVTGAGNQQGGGGLGGGGGFGGGGGGIL